MSTVRLHLGINKANLYHNLKATYKINKNLRNSIRNLLMIIRIYLIKVQTANFSNPK